VREKDSGILQNVRPSAVDVRGQQPELFPFDAFLYTTGRQGEKRTLTLKEGWEFIVKGRIETSEGIIAGWQITTNYLKSPTDAIRLDSQARRVEVRDSGGSPMIALGYLGGIGSYQSTDYGLYVAPTVKFEVGSGGSFKGGDYVVTDSGAFSIKSGAQEVVRLGSLGSGYYGIVIGTSGNQLRFSTEDGSLTVSGTITASSGNIGGWSITSQGLLGTNASLLSAGELVLGSSDEIVKLSSQDSTYRLWIGSVDPALAPFRVTKEGNVRAVAGVVGGWILDTTMLKSADSGARIELNQDKKRISVFDAYNETVAMGYLEGLPKRDGSGYWGAGDYGFWAKQGDRLRIDGDVEYIKGDWLIQNDASYLIKDSQDRVILRMGTDTGEKGFYLYDPTTSALQIRLGTKGTEKGLYVLENNTGLNYRAKLDTSGFFVGDDNNYVQYDRASSSLTMKVTSFLVSSMGTEIKGSVQISDEGTLGGGLVNPLKLYTSGNGTYKVGVIEQPNSLKVNIGGVEVFSALYPGVEVKGSIQLSNEGTVGGGLTNPLKLYTSGTGSAKVGVIEQVNAIKVTINNTERFLIKPTEVSFSASEGNYYGNPPRFIYKFLGYSGDAKPALILFAPKYVGTYLLKTGFMGRIVLSRGAADCFNISIFLDVVCVSAYDKTWAHLHEYSLYDAKYASFVEVTYQGTAYFGVRINNISTYGVTLIGELFGSQDPIFIPDASGYSYATAQDPSMSRGFLAGRLVIGCYADGTNLTTHRPLEFKFNDLFTLYFEKEHVYGNWMKDHIKGVESGNAKHFMTFWNGYISMFTTDPAGYRLRVYGNVLVDEYVRTKRFWELIVTAAGTTTAYRRNEDVSYTQLYYGAGRTGAYFIAALFAILTDMGKPTSNVILPASGGIRDMTVACVYKGDANTASLMGKVIASATYEYVISSGDSTTWDGALIFWA